MLIYVGSIFFAIFVLKGKLFQGSTCSNSYRWCGKNLPRCIAQCFPEDMIESFDVHDAFFYLHFPLVFVSRDFIVFTHQDIFLKDDIHNRARGITVWNSAKNNSYHSQRFHRRRDWGNYRQNLERVRRHVRLNINWSRFFKMQLTVGIGTFIWRWAQWSWRNIIADAVYLDNDFAIFV